MGSFVDRIAFAPVAVGSFNVSSVHAMSDLIASLGDACTY